MRPWAQARRLKAFEKSLQRTGLLPSGYSALPGSAAKIDAYGNMSLGQIVQILAYLKAFGEQGYSANITDKRKAALAKGRRKTGQRGIAYFVGRPSNDRLPLGVWQRISFGSLGSALKPVILFVTQPQYWQQLDVPGIAVGAGVKPTLFAGEVADFGCTSGPACIVENVPRVALVLASPP